MEDGLDTLGAEDVMAVGVDYGTILQAAGGLTTAAVSAAEQSKKEDADRATQYKQAQAAIAADVTAAAAMARADVSASNKLPSASIDAQAAQMAISAQDRAGSSLSENAQKQRAEAADAALAAVVKVAQSKPTDKHQAALVKAWTTVANKAHAGAISAAGKPGSGLDSYGGESWFTRPVVGKIPGYGVVIGGVGILGAGWLVVKKFFLK